MNQILKRIDYKHDLSDPLSAVAVDYGLGKYIKHDIIITGYEDLNLVLETENGKFFVKIFAQFRSDDDCKRYIEIMDRALAAGLNHPKLYASAQGELYIVEENDSKLRLCVMEYINGQSLYETTESLNDDDARFIVKQAALINQINLHPEPVYDSWAIVNFLAELENTRKYLTPDDKKLVEAAAADFAQINLAELPHCFIHGDLIKTNVMRDRNNALYILDFSVSNYYPRIQELAVLLCNVLFEENDPDRSKQLYQLVIDEYQKYITLTDLELKSLPTYIRAAHAMHIIGATHEKYENHNESDENEYWLNLGRAGLKNHLV